jgi:ribonuclease J
MCERHALTWEVGIFFKAVPLGGLGRIGGNMMIYETDTDLVMVDCGVLFPHEDQPGVDCIVPNVEYVTERLHKFRGIVLTHAHEDHIGALPYVLPLLNNPEVPVWGTAFTMAMVEQKLREHGHLKAVPKVFEDREIFSVGGFVFDPIPVTHSIPGAVMFAIQTPVGTVVHTGDFKLDQAPLDGRLTDQAALQDYGNKGVTLLLSDSTNSERPGIAWGEADVAEALMDVIGSAPQRVFVSTFASHIHRLQAIVDASVASGRKVIAAGRSMQQNVSMALERGFLKADASVFVEPAVFASLLPHEVTVVASGSQGEHFSALPRIIAGHYSPLVVQPGDRVVFSSRRIPGNERAVGSMVNALYRLGAEVIEDRHARIHTSGHAFAGEQKQVIEWCKPRYFIPLHGEYRHMKIHRDLAVSTGVDASRAMVLEDGHTWTFERDAGGEVVAVRSADVTAGPVFVEAGTAGDVTPAVLKERNALAETGIVFCSCVYSSGVGLVDGPDLAVRGVMAFDEDTDFLQQTTQEVRDVVVGMGRHADRDVLTESIRQAVRRCFRRDLSRKPLVVAWVHWV